jgi:hypothetical protein
MIRPVGWRDLGLLGRLHKQGVCLYARMGCTRGPDALLNALLEILPTGRRASTVVYRPEAKSDRAAIAQLYQESDSHSARVVFAAPADVLAHPEGVHLLDALVEAAGGRGAHHLLAEVPEDDLAFETLRQAGFAIYARQRIWRLASPPPVGEDLGLEAWRGMRSGDSAAVLAIYRDLVPPLVQQIEPSPACDRGCLVHWMEDALGAYLQIQRGPLGTWLQPFFHPSVDRAEALLAPVLRQLRVDRNHPLYLCVRSYQGWMNGMLERIGFEAWQDQAVMVKHLVAKVRKPVLARLRALDGTRPEPTSPIARTQNGAAVKRIRETT